MLPLTKKLQFLITLAAILALSAGAMFAQSGRSGMHGYVAFADLSYNDVTERKVHAKIELRKTADDKSSVTVETGRYGRFDFKTLVPGEYILRITSLGYRAYETEIYLPSDFIGNLAVMLKKEKPASR